MSIFVGKPPLKDPSRIPTAEDVDRHLGQYSRYARVVRGAARVAGLSTRLAWTNQGWEEQLRTEDAVLATINLVRVPPMASLPVSRALEEALATRVLPEPVKQALAAAEGTAVKWVEQELTGPIPADLMASLLSHKAELVKAGLVPITAAERPKVVPRPEPEPIRAAPPSARSVKPVVPAKPARAARPAPKPSKVQKPAKKAPLKALKAKKAPAKKPAAKSVKAKRR